LTTMLMLYRALATMHPYPAAVDEGHPTTTMEPLRDVILNVLRLAGPGGLSRTVLIKVVYFAQLDSWRERGEPLTDVTFYSYKYGAWAPDITHVVESVPALIEHAHFLYFYPTHNYKLRQDAPPPPQLSPEAAAILQRVFAKYGRMTALTVGNLSKQTEPMRHAEPGVPLDFSVVVPTPGLRIRHAGLARAQAAHDRSERGTREQLHERDVAEVRAWSEARRRANAS